jgi:predicted tellurium resistance membrane protein TerC
VELFANPEVWAAFATLTLLEIVLGIDNIIFISVITSRLPVAQQATGRYVGLSLAMIMRILLLLSLSWVMGMAKATREVHNSLEGVEHNGHVGAQLSLAGALVQIAVIDMVFSLDSVITAVGLVQEVWVMVAAIVTSVVVMMMAAGSISRFVEQHPTIKMLALAFLLLIGLTLVGEGLDIHTPKGYIYFAMAFSFGVEMLNLRTQTRRRPKEPVHLRKTQLADLVQLPTDNDSSGDSS